ncbi:hypothetical protein ACLOJK_014592, partial [Asimina triloba]
MAPDLHPPILLGSQRPELPCFDRPMESWTVGIADDAGRTFMTGWCCWFLRCLLGGVQLPEFAAGKIIDDGPPFSLN